MTTEDLEKRIDRLEMCMEEFRKVLHVWWADRNWPGDQEDPDGKDASDAMLERANR